MEADAAASAASALARTGVVDDSRYAALRASALAERGWGNEGIRFKLAAESVADGALEAALDGLPDERERARDLVARRDRSPRTLAQLARRGFSDETVEALSLQLAD